MNEREQFEAELKRCLVAVKSQVVSSREKTNSGHYVVELPESFLTLFETARAYAGLVDSELALQFCQFDSWARYRSMFLSHVISEFEEWLEWLALIAKNDSPTLFYWWQKRLFSLDFADKERRKHNDWQQDWVWLWSRAPKVLELLATEAVAFGIGETPCFNLSTRTHVISLTYDCTGFIKQIDDVFLIAKQIEIRKKAAAKEAQQQKEKESLAIKSIYQRIDRGEPSPPPIEFICKRLIDELGDLYWWERESDSMFRFNQLTNNAMKVDERINDQKLRFFVNFHRPDRSNGVMVIAEYARMEKMSDASRIINRDDSGAWCRPTIFLDEKFKTKLRRLIEDWQEWLSRKRDEVPPESISQFGGAVGSDGATIQQSALRAVVDGGLSGVLNQAESCSAVDKASATMFEMLKKDKAYYDWKLDDWVGHLKRARKTIIDTDAWVHILGWRNDNKKSVKVSDPKYTRN